MSEVSTCLWFDGEAEEAARLYVSLLPESRIDRVWSSPLDWPAGKAGDVLLVEFTLAGRPFQGLNGGSSQRLTPAASISVGCEDQAEIDSLWEALLAGGGKEVQCGWLEDRFGLSWQIAPKQMGELMSGPGAARVMQAMFGMVKLDLAALRKAAEAAA